MQVSASNFKTNCLKYMDNEQNNNIFGLLKGTLKFNDNIIDPLNEIEWEAQNGNIQLM